MYDVKEMLCNEVALRKEEMIKTCVETVRIPSETPPSDTIAMADYLYEVLRDVPGVSLSFHMKEEPVKNLVAVLKSGKPGKRLVFNGHIDTYPAGNHASWNESPWSGSIKDGFIYGRGSSDMKGGIACFITAFKVLAEHKDLWSGEIVLTLAGDEEAMGPRGTKYLLDSVPAAVGDAMICADVGAPTSLRFGQKGLLWFEIEAIGKPAHGAHLHKGESAINKLISALTRMDEEIPKLPFTMPAAIKEAILAGSAISEITAGPGETENLQKITVNIGTIKGGTSPNLVPEYAKAEGDIRIPAGATLMQIENKIKEIVADYQGLSYRVLRAFDANWSDVNHPLFSIAKENSELILQQPVVVTFRIGASDARLYRLEKGVPSINCGLTPYGLGGPNEHVSIDEMVNIAKIHTLIALDFLNA
ncbi:MAG: M20/M25/M40 family metallo-hydrolase [Bacillota bacterium]